MSYSGMLHRFDAEQRIARRWQLVASCHRFARKLFFLGLIIGDDLASLPGLPWRQSLRAWKNGFARKHFKMFGLHEAGSTKDFISDLQSLGTTQINRRHTEFISNKLASYTLLRQLDIPCPEVFGTIRNGELQPFGTQEFLPLKDSLSTGLLPKRLVLKQNWGCHGYGLLVLENGPDTLVLNGESLSPPDLARVLDGLDDYLAVAFVQQAPYARNIFPGAANTMRLLTAWDQEAHAPLLVRAVHRIGVEKTSPVDNFGGGKGGLSACIDQETGTLGPAAKVMDTYSVTWHDAHPETGSPIKGVTIPGWGGIRDAILDHARTLSFLPYLAWDVLVTETGFSVLEINSNSGLNVLQVHGPLLTDDRVRRFYRGHGVVR